MDLKIAIDERLAAYVPIIAAITGILMRFTPDSFDKKRFGPPVNFVVGVIVVVVVDALWGSFVPCEAILKGLLVAAMTSGLYDTGKAVKTTFNNKKNG